MKCIRYSLTLIGLTFGFGACSGGVSSLHEPAAPTVTSPIESTGSAPAPESEDVADYAADEELAATAETGREKGGAAAIAPSPPRASRDEGALVQPSAKVKAGEWDDNANFREFRQYLARQDGVGFERADVSMRRFLVVRDRDGRAVPNCTVSVRDQAQRAVSLTTTSSGRAILFPRAEGLGGILLEATASCDDGRARTRFTLEGDDGAVEMKLGSARALPSRPVLDLAFVLDTTGSMGEEIGAVKDTIRKVAGALGKLGVDVRVGLVEYRDVRDSFVTRVYPMSSDVAAFARQVDGLSAGGGGDTPENANRGLSVALKELAWSPRSVARIAILVADAPPHLDYPSEVSYVASMRQASHRGIQIHTIAASGMDDLGQTVWRQIAQYTGGTNMFVLRGGAGPQSTGGGDPKSSCGGAHRNYTSGNLAELITDKLRLAVASLDADPMRIAGLGQDERAKPCDARVVIAR